MQKLILILFSVFSFVGYSQEVNITIQKKELKKPSDNLAMAGAAFRNITPYWGLATAGHSMFASKGKGVHTKLKVRAIYLQDNQNNAIALVLLDLLAADPYLNHKVAELVNSKTGLTSAQIVLASTHTHKSFFSIASNQVMNSYLSDVKGFDKTLFDIVVQKTADAVVEAYNNRKPAKIATGRTQIEGFSVNRQIRSYAANFPKGTIDYKNPKAALESVNKSFNMIRIDTESKDGKYYPLATFCNFAAHGTAVSEESSMWGGDWYGVAHSYLDAKIKHEYKTPWQPINSISAGTLGDVEVNLKYQKTGNFLNTKQTNYDEINLKTEALSEKAFTLFKELDNKLKDNYSLGWSMVEKNIIEEHKIDSIDIGKKPMIGFSVAGSPRSNTGVKFFAGSFNPLTRKWWFNNKYHGKKRPMGAFSGIFHALFVGGPKNFPSLTIFQLVKVGDIVLAPIPYEVTTFSGYKIQEALALKLKVNKENINVLSNSNGSNAYLTAPKEYQTQDYSEGQSWNGLHALPFIIANLNKTAELFLTTPNSAKYKDEWSFSVKPISKAESYQPSNAKVFTIKREEIQPPYFFKGKETNLEIFQPAYRFEWKDVAYNSIQWDEDLVEVQQSTDKLNWKTVVDKNHQEVIDNGYYNLYLNIIDKKPKLNQDNISYRASWINPVLEENMYYRFVIKPRGNLPELYSSVFKN